MKDRFAFFLFLTTISFLTTACVTQRINYGPITGHVGDFSISPNDSLIVFSYYNSGVASIYLSSIDGQSINRLTTASTLSHLHPSFSPDGNTILFIETTKRGTPPSRVLSIIDIQGNGYKQITKDERNITEAMFSPDMKFIYFIQSNFYGHYSPMVKSRPHGFDIYKYDMATEEITRITDLNEYEMTNISFLPDGRTILYCTYEEHTSFKLLHLFNDPIAIKSFGPIGSFGSHEFFEPSFSSDGQYIAFTAIKNSFKCYQYDIYIMNYLNRKSHKITNLGHYAIQPHFYNHDKTILFMYADNWPDQPLKYELWSVDTNGTNLRKLNMHF